MLPPPGDDADDGAGLVFLSYSHADAAWAQRFCVLLSPLVRAKRLRLWDDSLIWAGDHWHPAIEQGIEHSRVALLLVSADYLASDYVVHHELPALRRHGVRLAPVLVGDCFWTVVLYTSRDEAVVRAAGAAPHPLGVLSPAAARASWPGRSSGRRTPCSPPRPCARWPRSGTSHWPSRCSPRRRGATGRGRT